MCSIHKIDVTNEFLCIAIKYIIFKYFEDKQKHFVVVNKNKYKKINIKVFFPILSSIKTYKQTQSVIQFALLANHNRVLYFKSIIPLSHAYLCVSYIFTF